MSVTDKLLSPSIGVRKEIGVFTHQSHAHEGKISSCMIGALKRCILFSEGLRMMQLLLYQLWSTFLWIPEGSLEGINLCLVQIPNARLKVDILLQLRNNLLPRRCNRHDRTARDLQRLAFLFRLGQDGASNLEEAGFRVLLNTRKMLRSDCHSVRELSLEIRQDDEPVVLWWCDGGHGS